MLVTHASTIGSETLRSLHGAVIAFPTAGDPRVARRGAGRFADHRVQRVQPPGPALPRAASPGVGDGSAAGVSRSGPGGAVAAHPEGGRGRRFADREPRVRL